MLRAASTRGLLVRRSLSNTAIPRTFEEMMAAPESAGLARSAKRVGTLLGDVMANHQPGLLDRVEQLRKKGRQWRSQEASLEDIVRDVSALSDGELRDVARAFAHFLALLNAAEQEYRVRRLEERRVGPLFPDKVDSCAGTVDLLLKEGSAGQKILETLAKQKVEIVLTAHPTEVHRRTLLTKHRRCTELLRALEDLPPSFERDETERELKGVVRALWGSDDLRRSKPTPQKEARGGLAFIETSLWDAVPAFLRRLDATLRTALDGESLPLRSTPLKISSWMGGDRDGNPNVTAVVTREVVAAQRRKGAAMYLELLDSLRLELSVRDATDEFLASYPSHDSEDPPYVALCDRLAARLRATVQWADAELAACRQQQQRENSSPSSDSLALGVKDVAPSLRGSTAPPLFAAEELLEPLLAAHASLRARGYESVADGALKDAIRRVGCFGLQLAPLDLRQESTRHTNAVDALRAATGKFEPGSYHALAEDAKIAWLSAELQEGRPLLRTETFENLLANEDPVDRDVVATCVYAAKHAPPESFGAYVISQAKSAADVLAVELLLSEAGMQKKPRVVPLFETLADLHNAPAQLEALFGAPGYLDRVGHVQEIMVGYSDSAKDAGRLAASYAQYVAQEEMLKVAAKFGVEVTFFHGKGGTVGRGGNPQTYEAVLAHPPKTIQGRFRVTEQGEMIAFNFGEPKLAERTLDVYTAGVLRDAFRDEPEVPQTWRDAMAKVSELSCAEYRDVVRHTPEFVPYFRAATPELELGALNVGSRPAKRNPKGGVESLRAIPWIFSWSQTRLNTPAWLGVSKLAELQPEVTKDMYSNWRWFATNVDLIESLLARTEPHIAKLYDEHLVHDASALELGASLRGKLQDTIAAVLAVTGRTAPAADNFLLQRALTLRNPYVDVLNVVQVEALKRHRANPDAALNDALLVAVNGIAAGLRQSG